MVKTLGMLRFVYIYGSYKNVGQMRSIKIYLHNAINKDYKKCSMEYLGVEIIIK